ncbi:hypothetical protein [Natrinema salaciae]|uniref:Uncharacterized protein n=1 Tax=Natrinema salaciae TaxID=1186196 RepID=A0A1H9PSE4_9EURY|nr:hypothetical protein [Natrinema salaciae]SER51246.1 hypothetical protein SAMN04489841_3965 [Natrinema salaciae]
MKGILRSVVGFPVRIGASARAALYRSEAKLNDEAASRLPDPVNLRTISEIDIHVRTRASYPRLSEFYSRRTLASISVELVDEAPPYDIVSLQRQLRASDIPVVQVFGDTLISRGALRLNERPLFAARDDSSFEVLIELSADVGDIERWIRDLDSELLEHLRDVENAVDEEFNLERYDHGERIATSITAHLERASRSTALDRLLTRVEEETDDVAVFRRYEPDWYLERVGGTDHPDTTILTVSHRYRIDDEWRDGAGTHEEEFTETEAALRWLREFRDDPPDYLDTR